MVIKKLKFLVLTTFTTITLLGCTRYDPYTGQQEVDVGATAGVAGLALGAAALGVAASNRNDRPNVTVINRAPPYRPYIRPYRRPYMGGGYRRGYYRR